MSNATCDSPSPAEALATRMEKILLSETSADVHFMVGDPETASNSEYYSPLCSKEASISCRNTLSSGARVGEIEDWKWDCHLLILS